MLNFHSLPLLRFVTFLFDHFLYRRRIFVWRKISFKFVLTQIIFSRKKNCIPIYFLREKKLSRARWNWSASKHEVRYGPETPKIHRREFQACVVYYHAITYFFFHFVAGTCYLLKIIIVRFSVLLFVRLFVCSLITVSLIWTYFLIIFSHFGINIEIYKLNKMAQSGFVAVSVIAVIVAVSLPEGKWH